MARQKRALMRVVDRVSQTILDQPERERRLENRDK